MPQKPYIPTIPSYEDAVRSERPIFLTEQEVSELFGLSLQFLRFSRCKTYPKNRPPSPPYLKLGSSVRYVFDDVRQWAIDLGSNGSGGGE